MASRQDQLHSYQFTVQRVVSALVMRDTDPQRSPFRRVGGATLAGILVATLSLAAVAVYGVLSPGAGADWRDPDAVIVERESGARYVYRDDVLHPVPNQASALLVIGSAQAHPVSVARSVIDGVPRGAPLGIPGAPDPLPARDRLLTGAWTLCSARVDGVVRSILHIGAAPPGGTELPAGTGLLVSTPDGTIHLIWRHTRYLVSRFALGALAWGSEIPTPVSPALVNALSTGPDLAAPVLPGTPGGPSRVRDARVGQVYLEKVPGGATQYAVAVPDGLAAITPVQAALLVAASRTGALELRPAEFTAYLTTAPLTPGGALAPPATSPPLARPRTAEDGLCATAGGTGSRLAIDVPLPSTGVAVRASDGPAVYADRVVLEPGRGALVSAMSSPTATSGTLSVISELGVRHPVPAPEVLTMLGYQGITPVRVPSNLVSLLPSGPTLDPAAARQPA
jgi:type VII secretion protein EccB